jgi:hypothetical protein
MAQEFVIQVEVPEKWKLAQFNGREIPIMEIIFPISRSNINAGDGIIKAGRAVFHALIL